MSDTNQDPFEVYPEEMKPVFCTPTLSQSILLHEGALILSDNVVGRGRVTLDFEPYYRIGFEMTSPTHVWNFGDSAFASETQMTLPDLGGTASVVHTGTDRKEGEREYRYTGDVLGVEFDDTVGLYEAAFHLVNFIPVLGARIRCGRSALTSGRIEFEAGGWQVTLDELSGRPKGNELSFSRGYAITHFARVRRADGVVFRPAELMEILHTLYYVFSLSCGRNCGPFLIAGYDADGKEVWRKWETVKLSNFRNRSVWTAEGLPGSIQHTARKLWNYRVGGQWYKPYCLAIDWYAEANTTPSPEISLILSQVGLEMLAWIELYEKNQILMKDREQSVSSYEKISVFLALANRQTIYTLHY